MNKKSFELLALLLFFLSLLYVPTEACRDAYYCIKGDWFFIWELEGRRHQVDIVRLLIQSAVVAGLLATFWRFKYKD
jgi:hypothetical protein